MVSRMAGNFLTPSLFFFSSLYSGSAISSLYTVGAWPWLGKSYSRIWNGVLRRNFDSLEESGFTTSSDRCLEVDL